jgi:hypothetical protein
MLHFELPLLAVTWTRIYFRLFMYCPSNTTYSTVQYSTNISSLKKLVPFLTRCPELDDVRLGEQLALPLLQLHSSRGPRGLAPSSSQELAPRRSCLRTLWLYGAQSSSLEGPQASQAQDAEVDQADGLSHKTGGLVLSLTEFQHYEAVSAANCWMNRELLVLFDFFVLSHDPSLRPFKSGILGSGRYIK